MYDIQPCEKVILYNDMQAYKYIKVTKEADLTLCEVWIYPFEDAAKWELNPKEKTAVFHVKEDNKFHEMKHFLQWGIFEELFLQYAEIEVRELKPSRQIYDGVTCLYNNKTKSTIEIIDSTWFTTLVKSDEFKVRGHFRLQPCGESYSKRKLIWISDFKKHGYTREAKKLISDGQRSI